jgi:hypothetical protein
MTFFVVEGDNAASACGREGSCGLARFSVGWQDETLAEI